MAREIPEVVRAAAGLAATVLDEARRLPETLPGLPVRVLGMAMQQAMKVQQQYAGLVARGDELFTGLRGENEPGMATFDDDEPAPAGNGFRESAFDRADDTYTADDTLTDAEVGSLPADPAADAVVAVVDELADQIEGGEQSIEELVEESPETAEILDEIAIDELVDQAPTLEETAPLALVDDAPPTEDADALESALLESGDAPAATADAVPDLDVTADVATTVDVITPAGDIETVEAAVTEEGIAAPESPEAGEAAADDDTVASTDVAGTESATGTDTNTDDTATDTGSAPVMDESGSQVAATTDVRTDVTGAGTPADDSDAAGSPAAATAPIEGYDSFSIAQLRGRLRGYALSTVAGLLAYEEATRAREPYLRMLRNRLEKLEEQAVESSPLAPRGA